jgi:hypothetical protein
MVKESNLITKGAKTMKKAKRLVAMVACVAMAVSAISMQANATSVDWDLSSSYTKTPLSYAKMVYDIGSILPYDDVSAGTHTKLQGSTGNAKVSLTGANGGTASNADYSANSDGWFITDWATVGGTDTARNITHSGNTGTNTFNYYVT